MFEFSRYRIIHQFGYSYRWIDRIISKDIPSVTADNYMGGILAANRLIEANCRKMFSSEALKHYLLLMNAQTVFYKPYSAIQIFKFIQ